MDRFWEKVDKTPTCWLWTGATAEGYGRFRLSNPRRLVQAHRFAYELLVGPIPPGVEPDHLCRVRRCVNPAHLELVTRSINVDRGDHANRRKTVCRNGHPLTPANTYDAPGRRHRVCRECQRAAVPQAPRR